MENRLSDVALTSSYDSGHQSLPWQPGQPGGLLAAIDLDEIMAHPQATEIIQSLPTQPLYFALKRRGPGECLEVLERITQDQLVHIVDYDGWSKDELVPQKVYQWLKLFGEISKEQLYTRYAHLDEETQVALLQGLVQVFDLEEAENLPEGEKDQLYPMPCRTVFYRILSEDPDTIAFVERLIDACSEVNLRYAYSLLGHASYMPPRESELQLRQFREARLQEDGFLTYAESQELFRPIDLSSLQTKWHTPEKFPEGLTLSRVSQAGSFLEQVMAKAQSEGWSTDQLYQLHVGLLHVANGFCAASQVEPDDLYGLHRILDQLKALASCGLAYLAGGDDKRGLAVLAQEHPKTLVQVGLTLVDHLRAQLLARLNTLGIPHADELKRWHHGQRWGVILRELDTRLRVRLGFETTEILKGVFNRYPMIPALDWEELRHGQQITFQPIDSLERLQQLTQYTNGLSALMFLWAQAPGQPLMLSLEKALSTGMVNALCEGTFAVKPVSPASLQAFCQLDEAAYHMQGEQLRGDLRDVLQTQEKLWQLDTEFAMGDKPARWAVSIFEDMTAGLALARQNSPSAVAGLVWMETGEA